MQREERTTDWLLERLVHIVSAHQDQQDSLSIELATWGGQLVTLYLEDASDACLEATIKKIGDLQKILVNPMDLAPLKHPVLVEGRLWEQWMFTLYRSRSDLCPFFRGRLSREQTDHQFAREMIEWLEEVKVFCRAQNIEASFTEEDPSQFLQEDDLRNLNTVSLVQGFQNLATITRRRMQSAQFEEKFTEIASSFRHQQDTLLQEIEKAKEDLKKVIGERDAERDAACEARIAELNKQLIEQKEQLDSLEKRVQQTELEAQQHRNSIANLQDSLARAQRNINALQNQPQKKERGCLIM
ncbi:MAG: hypothetical protein KGI80_04690 [Verrucomicrobiota bacterium]|nr:hypothetical protein [Verrucomicrobiota bacterium]